MPLQNEALVLDLVEWVAREPRTYAQVMEAWRTSCPRLPICEDALEHGLVSLARGDEAAPIVVPTEAGRALLTSKRFASET